MFCVCLVVCVLSCCCFYFVAVDSVKCFSICVASPRNQLYSISFDNKVHKVLPPTRRQQQRHTKLRAHIHSGQCEIEIIHILCRFVCAGRVAEEECRSPCDMDVKCSSRYILALVQVCDYMMWNAFDKIAYYTATPVIPVAAILQFCCA